LLGKFVSFEDHVKSRSKSNVSTITKSKDGYGRAGNRIYTLNKNGEYTLFKKCKNSTKAKKFMETLV